MLQWFISPSALPCRLAVGVLILLALALHDLHRRGRQATRWREYFFLLICTAAAMVYGVINDLITSTISWEYFWHFKGLYRVIERDPRHAPGPFRLQVLKIALQATWWVGLLAGVVLLLANNPLRSWPRLTYRRLAGNMLIIFACAAGLAVIGGLVGHTGVFARFIETFRVIQQAEGLRPNRLMAAWGVHFGGYLGAALGAVLAVSNILFARRRLARTAVPSSLRINQ